MSIHKMKEGHDLVEVSSNQIEYHPGGRKRLHDVLQDFQMTMQHAIRQDLQGKLIERANAEAGVLPPLTAAEMFDYLRDSDDEFYNWCFPYCAITLTAQTLSPIHVQVLAVFRQSLNSD